MNREKWGYAESIQAAIAIIPSTIWQRISYVHFFTGTDPIWAGLHSIEMISDGRSYRNTAHVVYPFHQKHLPASMRATTVVLPIPEHPIVVVHELGHVLDEALRFQYLAEPVTDYACTNRLEAFAEAMGSDLYERLDSDEPRGRKPR